MYYGCSSLNDRRRKTLSLQRTAKGRQTPPTAPPKPREDGCGAVERVGTVPGGEERLWNGVDRSV